MKEFIEMWMALLERLKIMFSKAHGKEIILTEYIIYAFFSFFSVKKINSRAS